ncbi:alpha/beta hydrolase family esterase [Pseudaestuariivita atlantica]|uniref:Polyhydroxybutyrate depolymerase n=1 Tax=Pseudaestuariivita atlantica TaxID=1317121 RepID=A0A0L1JM25_9RHOB|nr:PHB depolymerase family esterase [Pseudaestuariivita atlantica]KNG92782.1 polyhydroxybutyrate depolymerase [Pseudaestuariivita atlantica]
MRLVRLLQACLAAVVLAPAAWAQTCGGVDAPCEIAEGSYHIVLPEGEGPYPVMMFLHGFRGQAASLVRNGGTSRRATERGWAYIAPQGLTRPNGQGTSWSFHPNWPPQRDETAFFDAVLADAAERFGVDPDRAVLAGFSIGGSMVTYAACARPDQFMAYAPVSGSFWRPHPVDCAGPVRLLHTHGWRDGTVPLEGRYLGERNGMAFHQGDAFYAMDLFRTENGCRQTRPSAFEVGETFWRRRWEDCAPGSALEFALFAGGHGVPPGWADMVLDWAESLPLRP